MFSIKGLFLFIAWCAILFATYVTSKELPERLAMMPAVLARDIFALFVMFAILSALLSRKNRGFWTGVAVFGIVPFLRDAIRGPAFFQHETAGQCVLGLLGFGVDPNVAGDDQYAFYVNAMVPVADLLIASLCSLVGGYIGGYIGKKQNLNYGQDDVTVNGNVEAPDSR